MRNKLTSLLYFICKRRYYLQGARAVPRLNPPKNGSPVIVKNRPVHFSRWPVKKTSRRYALQPTLFASSPWSIIHTSLRHSLTGPLLDETSAYIEQAQDYFRAANESVTIATKPVLFYYSFLNIAKSYIALRRNLNRSSARHGLSEKVPAGGKELEDAIIEAYRTTASTFNVFDSLTRVLTGSPIPHGTTTYAVKELLSQIIQGHRIWCGVTGETERFVNLQTIRILFNRSTKEIWNALYVYADDLSRLGLSRKRFLSGSGLAQEFHEVRHNAAKAGRPILKFEQKTSVRYTHRPSDKLQAAVDTVTPHLWTNITSLPPYRRYYVYVSLTGGRKAINQILAIYAVFYYLGSVTRYRPQKYAAIMTGPYGALLHEVLENLPNQFAYLMASEFAQQEVARAAII